MKMEIKLLLLFTKFCHCFHILILDMLIGKGFKINVPHGMNVYGNTDSNVNVMLCKIAIPPKSVRFLGINTHWLRKRFSWTTQRIPWNDRSLINEIKNISWPLSLCLPLVTCIFLYLHIIFIRNSIGRTVLLDISIYSSLFLDFFLKSYDIIMGKKHESPPKC